MKLFRFKEGIKEIYSPIIEFDDEIGLDEYEVTYVADYSIDPFHFSSDVWNLIIETFAKHL